MCPRESSSQLSDEKPPLHEKFAIMVGKAEFGAPYLEALQAASPIPEPATLAVLAVGTMGLIRRRGRREETNIKV
jgi:hypothetical protein